MVPDEFIDQLKYVGDKILESDSAFVVSHHDADGITSCAITVDFLRAKDVKVEYMCIKQLDSVTIGEIEKHRDKTLIFTDMGSGQQTLLAEHGVHDYFIVDHHPPEKDNPNQLNPHDFGFDGGKEISGSGMTYLLAKTMGHERMAHLAVVGAVGDMQDRSGSLKSLNRIAIADAVAQGTLIVENDVRMFGRQSRSLSQMLAYTSEPLIPGVTGDQQSAMQFIQDTGIELKNDLDEWRSYAELEPSEREKLVTAIYMRLVDHNVPEYILNSITGEVYTLAQEEFKSELRDAKEFATVLNACGRQEQPALGVEVCLGDRGLKWAQAQQMLERHRKTLREGLEYLTQNGVTTLENLHYFDAGDIIKESIIGVVAGMAYGARIIPPDKPILAFAQDRDDETKIKVSSRANGALLRKGIHLGNAMRKCSKEVGGEGGGHDIAAGARLPKDKKDEFLACVDTLFLEQKNQRL